MTFRLNSIRALAVSIALGAPPLLAQEGDGVEVQVSAQAETMITLAEQLYPDLFGQAGDWSVYQEYTYKFYPGSGIYVGISEGQVYLLGGPFGDSITAYGSVADTAAFLQAEADAEGLSGSFENLVAATAVNDITDFFSVIEVEYFHEANGSSDTASVRLEVTGQEEVGGVLTDHIQATIRADDETTAELWVDDSGRVQKLLMGGMEFTGNDAQMAGGGLLSAFVLILAAGNGEDVIDTVSGVLQNQGEVEQNTVTRDLIGVEVSTLATEISVADSLYTLELSDFGTFSMITRIEGSFGGASGGFTVTEAALR